MLFLLISMLRFHDTRSLNAIAHNMNYTFRHHIIFKKMNAKIKKEQIYLHVGRHWFIFLNLHVFCWVFYILYEYNNRPAIYSPNTYKTLTKSWNIQNRKDRGNPWNYYCAWWPYLYHYFPIVGYNFIETYTTI